MKFLVVDDSSTMRRVMVNNLGRIGYTDVVEAEDGQEAFARFAAGGIDFIMSDWNMPNMSGIELARAVRGHAAGGSVPIIMVTTRSAHEDIVTAVEAKVNNYILKPFTPATLKEKIDDVLKALSQQAA